MNSIRKAALVAATILVGMGTPAIGESEYPFTDGEYVTVSRIGVDDGHDLDYARHLAGQWRKGQEFAKSQGWITGYEVLYNVHKRDGEPDIYLLTRFARFADPAEEERRDEAYRAHMQRTDTQMQAETGERAKYRKLMGTTLLRKLEFKK